MGDSLVFEDPWAALAYWGTYSVFVLLDVGLVQRSLGGRLPDAAAADLVRGPVHRPAGLLWILGAEAAGIAAAAVGATVLPWRWALLALGLALAWAGIVLRFTAKRTLGRFFVGAIVIQSDHEVVTTGPYAVIRHPGYAGSLVALLGLGVATADVLAMVLFTLVPAIVFVRTIEREDAVLGAHLGPAHAEYLRRTAKLVPGIW